MRQLIAAALRRVVSFSGTLDGYENPELVDVVFRKTVAYEPSGEWPEMAHASTVLDFGGGCGVHYKQARSPIVRWAVVETPAMIERASELATDRLRFFESIGDAADWLGGVDVMYSKGAIQYADPEKNLTRLCALKAKRMIWDSVVLSRNRTKTKTQLSLIGENGPSSVRKFRGRAVRYRLTAIPERKFMDAHADYILSERGIDWFRFELR